MNFSKREKLLGGAIITILGGWLFGNYVVYNAWQAVTSRSQKLATVKETYEENVSRLKKGAAIRSEYAELVGNQGQTSPDVQKDPQKEFSEFISDLCRRLGFTYPRIEPPKTEPIQGVDDYSFITLTVSTQGTRESVANMMKGFDKEAVLIRDLTLRTFLDSPQMDVSITVARLVQISPDKRRTGSDKKTPSGAAPSSLRARTPREPVSAEKDEDDF